MRIEEVRGGFALHAQFPTTEVVSWIAEKTGPLPLIIADPPYGNIVDDAWDKVAEDDRAFCRWMLSWTNVLATLSAPQSALYVWGGIGTPRFRPFYRYLVEVEHETPYRLASHITWAKKRAYGIRWNYLFTREELAYLILGDDIKKPRKFSVPLLAQKRGYAGYDPKYPAKSEYLRRTNVWQDITEILRGKVHKAQKPERLYEIPIEIHTKPGEWVLDPFSGSGTLARAARKLDRKFLMVESDLQIFERAVESLRNSS